MKNERKYCAIFDLDGVIVDTAKYHYLAWKKIAATFGHDLTEQENEQLKGVSRVDSLHLILGFAQTRLDAEAFAHCLTQKNEDYLQFITTVNSKDLLSGIAEALTFLKAQGIPIALGSASKNAQVILDQLGVTSYFEVIVDGNNVQKSKPDPEVFVKGSEALGISPQHCVVFEDSTAGIQAAKAAGMTAIALGDPSNFDQPDYCFPDFTYLNEDVLTKIFHLS